MYPALFNLTHKTSNPVNTTSNSTSSAYEPKSSVSIEKTVDSNSAGYAEVIITF